MKVFYENGKNIKEVANIPLKISSIMFSGICNDGISLLIPYGDKELLKAVSCLIYNAAGINQPNWGQPDCGNSRLYLFVDMERNTISLSVEAIPQKYSEKDKASILADINKDNIFTSERNALISEWNEIFKNSEEWYNKEINNGEVWNYDIQLSPKDENILKLALLNMMGR